MSDFDNDYKHQLAIAAERLFSSPPTSPRPDTARPRNVDASRRSRVHWRVSRRAVGASVVVALLMTAVALAAAGVFDEGTTLGPETPASAHQREGVALPGTIKLLHLSTPDPAGGPPWGLRVARTTRGLTCVSIGRVDYGTVGVLGQDGAFANDGRFHPLSPNYFEPLGCAVTDARGRGFVNVAMKELPASGLWGESGADGGCSPAPSRPLRQITCPAGDVREAFFGLLGPDARTITYNLPEGGTRTTRLLGPDGAYLLVFREGSVPRNPDGSGSTGGPGLSAGEIVAVTYADGSTCRVPAQSLFESCPPVGFTAPRAKLPSTRQLATTVAVRLRQANRYCTNGRAIAPCAGEPSPGYEPAHASGEDMRGLVLAEISFRAPVPITSSRGFYETELRYSASPHCNQQGANSPTDYDIRAGERVTVDLLLPRRCSRRVTGWVEYVPADGAATATPVIGLPGQGKPIRIARIGFRAP
jgi:hypothetical protein